MDTCYFIINPLASSGKAVIAWSKCEKYLNKNNINYKAFITSYAGHATLIATELTNGRERNISKTIIVIGGDGTLGDVINGINVAAKVTIALIPCGSGNDFARYEKLSKRPVKRLKYIMSENNIANIDYGVLSFIYKDMRQRRFMVSAGVGVDATICEKVNYSKVKTIFNRIKVGKISYIVLGIKQLTSEKPFRMKVYVNRNKKYEFKNIRFVSIHLLPGEGGGFRLAPKADNMDGSFELCVVDCKNRFHLINIMIASIVGKHVNMNGVHILQCKSALFESDEHICVHTDGEICGYLNKFIIECEKRKVRMIL